MNHRYIEQKKLRAFAWILLWMPLVCIGNGNISLFNEPKTNLKSVNDKLWYLTFYHAISEITLTCNTLVKWLTHYTLLNSVETSILFEHHFRNNTFLWNQVWWILMYLQYVSIGFIGRFLWTKLSNMWFRKLSTQNLYSI